MRVEKNRSTFSMWEAMRHYFMMASHGREGERGGDGPVVDPHKPSILGSKRITGIPDEPRIKCASGMCGYV